MINWPVSRKRAQPDSDWLKYVSDDDLDVLMVLYDASCALPLPGRPAVSVAPVTPETERLVRDIKARAAPDAAGSRTAGRG